jgi:crossover junction endodeoxyribonuclease RuvC
MLILGVDPGSRRTGFGLIATNGTHRELVAKGVVSPPPRLSIEERLKWIHEAIAALIARHRPHAMAVEDVFHSVNSRTALVLGHVRGVILLAGAEGGIPVAAYPAATVKLGVTGSGRADKSQVAFMVNRILGLSTRGQAGDAADALAVALCHAQHAGLLQEAL